MWSLRFWSSFIRGRSEFAVRPSLVVARAPEPDEVIWENLEQDDRHEAKVEMQANALLKLLILGGVTSLSLAKWLASLITFSSHFHVLDMLVDILVRQVISFGGALAQHANCERISCPAPIQLAGIHHFALPRILVWAVDNSACVAQNYA